MTGVFQTAKTRRSRLGSGA